MKLFYILLTLYLADKSSAFSTKVAPTNGRSTTFLAAAFQPSVVIVGKIIVDEYGNPEEEKKGTSPNKNVTVGGGGPQAALGAALALATRSFVHDERMTMTETSPPPQPVTLMGAVGDLDFSSDEEEALKKILQSACQDAPRILRGKDLFTPRIRLWHDKQQVLQWYALNDSFGPAGAGGLWACIPSADDYLEVITEKKREKQSAKPILHIISEAGAEAPGGNGDSLPLLDQKLRNSISFLGVEPILFPNEENGRVSEKDAVHCASLLQKILDVQTEANSASVCFSPDMAAFTALDGFLPRSRALDSWAVRNGPDGSHLYPQSTHIPASSLKELVNPTGAGNAYSAAFTALRGSGCDPIESACIATGVGAVFCEYSHCPPYTWDVIERVAAASKQVETEVLEEVVGRC